jgi:hypothetical protein
VAMAMVMRYFRREDSQISVGVHQSALHRYGDESLTSDCFRLALGGSSETLRRLVVVAMAMRYFRKSLRGAAQIRRRISRLWLFRAGTGWLRGLSGDVIIGTVSP